MIYYLKYKYVNSAKWTSDSSTVEQSLAQKNLWLRNIAYFLHDKKLSFWKQWLYPDKHEYTRQHLICFDSI